MNSLLSLGGWSIVPDLATRYLLEFVYTTGPLTRLLRLTPARPGTPQYRTHYGITFALVVLGYLTYTMVDNARRLPPNFYQILGVDQGVDEAGLKVAFRKFAKRFHPDRPDVGQQGEAMFIYVRDVYEALKDPAVRFAYDRFGPDALQWRQTCTTRREFLQHGLMASSGYHIVAFICLLFWSAVGKASSISFWRYILFSSLLAAELALILSPTRWTSSTILAAFFPQRVAFQHILFLHQLLMFLSVAITRVAPFLLPYDEFTDPRVEHELVERTAALISVADREASKLIHTELQSIASEPNAQHNLQSSAVPRHPSFSAMHPVPPQTAAQLLSELAPEMEQLVLEANLKKSSTSPGPLGSAWAAAVARAHARLLEARETVVETLSPRKASLSLAVDGDDDGEEETGFVRGSRETTPTAQDPSSSRLITTPNRPQDRYLTPELDPHPISSPSQRFASASTNGTPVRVKQEEPEVEASALFGGSGYFVVPNSQSSPDASPALRGASTPGGMANGLLRKSVPNTPGELPSPRPSPSPPPAGSQRLAAMSPFRLPADGVVPQGGFTRQPNQFAFPTRGRAGYFARGTAAAGEDEGSENEGELRLVRARSLSC